MLVFYSHKHALHAPQWYVADGTVRPCPEVPARAEALLEALRSSGHSIRNVDGESSPGSPIDPLPILQAVHAPDYLDYLRTIHVTWFEEFHCEVIPDTFCRRPGPQPNKPAAQAGYYCFDMAAPITAGTWDAAIAAVQCALSAAVSLQRGEKVSYALCRPPGHHAGPDYCGGFCYLNNAAAAAQFLLHQGAKRIALLDIDYHHGNGSQDIFYQRADVLYVSIHADPHTQYPYYWGYSEQNGEGAGLGFNRNFPLPRGVAEAPWLQTLDEALLVIRQYDPAALVISLGLDISEADTVGDFKLSHGVFPQIGRSLAQLRLPTVFVQEGGYNVPELGTCLLPLLAEFEHVA